MTIISGGSSHQQSNRQELCECVEPDGSLVPGGGCYSWMTPGFCAGVNQNLERDGLTRRWRPFLPDLRDAFAAAEPDFTHQSVASR